VKDALPKHAQHRFLAAHDRFLEEITNPFGPNTPSSIADLCKNEMFISFCDGGGSSGNDQGGESADRMCMTKASSDLYCNVVCAEECDSYFANQGNSGNDASEKENPERKASKKNPFESAEDVAQMCGGGCLPKLMSASKAMAKKLEKCPKPEGADSEGNRPGKGLDESGSMNFMCQQNDKGRYCMTEWSGLEKLENNSKPSEMNGTLTCDSVQVSSLVDMGCCFGSLLQFSTENKTENQKEYKIVAWHVTKCGGSILPCSEGSVYGAASLSSSIEIQAEGLDEEFLQKPETMASLEKSISETINSRAGKDLVTSSDVIITGFTKEGAAAGRSLAANSVTVEYTVLKQGTMEASPESSAISNAMAGIDSSELTSSLKTQPSFADFTTSLQTTPSREPPTVKTVDSASDDNSGLAVGAVIGIAIAAIGAVAAAVVLARTKKVARPGSNEAVVSQQANAVEMAPSQNV